MRRKISSILVALMLMFCLSTTAYAAISPHGVEDAFNPEWSESADSYADSFGWNTDNIMSFQWTDEDGDPYERQTGWQQDFYENNVLTTMQYLGINDGGIGGVGGTGAPAAILSPSLWENSAKRILWKSRLAPINASTMTGTGGKVLPRSGARRLYAGARTNVGIWAVSYRKPPVVQLCLTC